METENRCWICTLEIKDSMLLPYEDDYIGQQLSLFKNTFVIKDFGPFQFLYYTCCNDCIESYIKKKNCMFKFIKNREIGKP